MRFSSIDPMSSGARNATSIDVAREAGVSQATVSRVLNGRTNVSPEVRAQVEAAIAKLGYRPNFSARSLVTNRTRTVGVVVGDLGNTYYVELLQTVSEGLARAGYRTLMLSDRGGGAQDLAAVLWETDVDGIIVLTSLLAPADEERIASLAVPTVTLGPHRFAGADSVTPDNVAGGRLAAEHLLALGHRRIGVVAGPLEAASIAERHAGFVAGLMDAGVTLDPSLVVPGELAHDPAAAATRTLLDAAEPPTAIFCLNDLMGFAALNAVHAAGLRVPDDVSVLGFDDLKMAGWEAFRLTTVRQPIAEMASAAARLLLRRFDDPAASPTAEVLPCTFVLRNTTGAPAAQ